MDILHQYLPQLYAAYNTIYAPYVLPIYRVLLQSQSLFYRHVFPLVYPVLTLTNTFLRSVSGQHIDLVNLAILAIVLFVSLRILDYVRRAVFFWVGVFVRMTFWAALAGLGLFVYGRGLEHSVEDLGWLIGILAGLGERGGEVGNEKAWEREREERKLRMMGNRGRTSGAGW